MRSVFIKIMMIVLIIPCLLSGCSVFAPVKTEQANTYVLNALPQPIIKKPTHPITILVMVPEASAIFDTTQMAYSTQIYKISYFAKHAWANTPAQMLQYLLMQSLQNTHYFYAVGTPSTMGQFDYVLSTQLIQFYQRFAVSTSDIVLVLKAQITRASSNRVIASKQFSVIEHAPENTPYGGVIAANRATANLLSQVTKFCSQKIQ